MKNKKIEEIIKKLYIPANDSHKGKNGRLLIIGGSHLFHAASLWALKVASRIVDLVHYSSIEENNKIVQGLKEEFRDGIVVSRSEIESYIEEDDCILIGPGMLRAENSKLKTPASAEASAGRQNLKLQLKIQKLEDILKLKDEGMQTYYLTKYLLQKYPKKKWTIDAGALQMIDPEDIPENSILTPHKKELDLLKAKIPSFAKASTGKQNSKEDIKYFADKYNCIILLKGKEDMVASKDKMEVIQGGNAGMTKGGTGDVLAGLVAALYCKNDAFVSAITASYINKQAGEELYKKMGLWFNASDLADQIPMTMKRLLLD